MIWQALRKSIAARIEGATNVVFIEKVMMLTSLCALREHMRGECDTHTQVSTAVTMTRICVSEWHQMTQTSGLGLIIQF